MSSSRTARSARPVRPVRTLTALDALAVRTRNGEVAATEEFLVALSGQIEAFVRLRSRRMGARGPGADVCADLAQDLLIELWQTDLPRWDPARGAFLTFARSRMGWHVASWMRAQSRFSDDSVLMEAPAPHADPEALLGRARRERALRALTHAIDTRLTRQERAVVQHVDLEERQLTTHAKKKKVHVSSACRLRQRAHARLADALEGRPELGLAA